MKNSQKRKFKIENLEIWHFLIAALIVYTIPFLGYILNFYSFSKDPKTWISFSSNPGDWASLGDYLGGVTGSLLSLINIFAVIWLALKVFHLETKRDEGMYDRETKREKDLQALSVRPFCTTFSSDYVNEIKVVVRNYGIGLAKIKTIKIENSTGECVEDLIKLMPSQPEGLDWRDFTINGFSYIPAGGEVTLIWLEGDEENSDFSRFRDEVRKELSKISVTIEYTDIFDSKTERLTEALRGVFSR